MGDIEAAVDAFIAERFGLRAAALHERHVHVVPWPAGERGADLLRIGSTCIAVVEVGALDHARSVVAHLDPDAAFDRRVAASLAAPDAQVLGPSWHGYADIGSFRPVAGALDSVRRIEADDVRLARLRDACDAGEWAEGGFPPDLAAEVPATTVLYGLDVEGSLVAAGNMTEWRGAPGDLGLVTHPRHRGKGFATSVAAAMAADWLPVVGVVRYRALLTNSASLAVAARLGFRGYGQNIRARPGLHPSGSSGGGRS